MAYENIYGAGGAGAPDPFEEAMKQRQQQYPQSTTPPYVDPATQSALSTGSPWKDNPNTGVTGGTGARDARAEQQTYGNVPPEWAADFLARNPGDTHRVQDAYASDQQPKYDAPQQAQTGTAAPPSWFESWFTDQRARATAADAERKAKADSLYNTWLGRSQQSLAVDRNDPIIRQQADAYNANEQRAQRNYLGDVAEGAGPLANLRGEERMSSERLGQRTGTFESQLIGRELQTKRDEIAQALNSMAGMLSADQQAGLQRELSTIDAAIAQQGLGLQQQGLDQDWQRALRSNNQFMSDLGLRAENQYNYWNDPLRGGN